MRGETERVERETERGESGRPEGRMKERAAEVFGMNVKDHAEWLRCNERNCVCCSSIEIVFVTRSFKNYFNNMLLEKNCPDAD